MDDIGYDISTKIHSGKVYVAVGKTAHATIHTIMNAQAPRRVGASSRGFTIVELLIVVVVIAILAAITIISYNGISNRAKESAVLSDASQAYKKVKTHSITNGDAAVANLGDAGITSSDGTTYQYTTSGTDGFCLTAVKDGRSSYTASNYSYNNGTILEQPTATLGACPGHSSAGGTIIRNLVPNPSFEVSGYGWSTTSSNAATSTNWASSGSRSFRVTNTGTSNAGDFRVAGSGLTVIPAGLEAGKTYTISARVNMVAAPTGGYSRSPGVLTWASTNGSTWVENFGPKPPATAGIHTVSHTVTIPANATGVIFGFGVASSTASQVVYYDSIMVTEGTATHTYADGTSTDWIWTGVPNESISTGPAL